MSFTIGQKPASKIERIEDGTYVARLVQLIDFGVQPQTDFQTGEDKAPAHRLWVVFELPTELIKVGDEERPRWQGREYTLSFHEKSGLTALIKALDPAGKAKNLTELLDNPCMVTIGSTKSGNPKIVNVTGVPKGVPVPPLQNPAKVFEMENPDMEVYESLPDWMKEKITSSLKFEGSELASLLKSGSKNKNKKVAPTQDFSEDTDVDYDDDLPF